MSNMYEVKAAAIVVLMEDGTKKTFLIRGRDLIDARIDCKYIYPGEPWGYYTPRNMDATFRIECTAYTMIEGTPDQTIFDAEQEALGGRKAIESPVIETGPSL